MERRRDRPYILVKYILHALKKASAKQSTFTIFTEFLCLVILSISALMLIHVYFNSIFRTKASLKLPNINVFSVTKPYLDKRLISKGARLHS